jgi:hypothetical protein
VGAQIIADNFIIIPISCLTWQAEVLVCLLGAAAKFTITAHRPVSPPPWHKCEVPIFLPCRNNVINAFFWKKAPADYFTFFARQGKPVIVPALPAAESQRQSLHRLYLPSVFPATRHRLERTGFSVNVHKKNNPATWVVEMEDKPMVRMRGEPISQPSALLSPPERSGVDTGKRTATRSLPALAQAVGRHPVYRRAADKVCLLAGESMKRAGNRLLVSQKTLSAD